VSRMLGVTPHQLSRIINDMTGMNFRNYLNSFRVREAQNLLHEKPDMSVIEIAFSIGFNSKSSFNDAFLKTTGVSPRDYRSKTKAEDK
jgi:AraC-like DNA-binding protein